METEKLFEIATRNKYTFPYRGQIGVSDLWDLKLNQLNELFKTLKSMYPATDESLIETETTETYELDRKVEIVKYVFSVKKQEQVEREVAAEKRIKKVRLQELLAKKQDEGLNALSEQELQDMLNNM